MFYIVAIFNDFNQTVLLWAREKVEQGATSPKTAKESDSSLIQNPRFPEKAERR